MLRRCPAAPGLPRQVPRSLALLVLFIRQSRGKVAPATAYFPASCRTCGLLQLPHRIVIRAEANLLISRSQVYTPRRGIKKPSCNEGFNLGVIIFPSASFG